jgi:hydrogenase maturation protease
MAGTVRSFDPRAMPPTGRAFGMSTHDFGVAWTLELARALHRLPARCRVFAVEGERFDQRMGLSPAVEAALDEVLEQITAQIARLHVTVEIEGDG